MTFQSSGTNDCEYEIVEKYSSMVYKLAFARTKNKSDAEDIFQEVFLTYIRRNPTFENEEHEKAWFIRVTINCTKDLWSYNKKRMHEELDENICLASRNLGNVKVVLPTEVNTYDVVNSDKMVMTEASLKKLEEVLDNE